MAACRIHRLHLIANPKGGLGGNLRTAEQVAETLGAQGINVRVHITRYKGHACEIVRQIDYQPGVIVCALGGDGTMHEVINGNMERSESGRFPLGLFPGGTGNALLSDLDLLNPKQVCDRILKNRSRRIDLFRVQTNRHTFFASNIVGWGLFAEGNRLAESLRAFGRLRYDLAGLIGILMHRTYAGTLSFDDQSIKSCFHLIAASNTCHTGKGMLLSPQAKLDDGKLDLLFVQPVTRRQLLGMFARLKKGTHVGDPSVSYVQTSGFEIQSDRSMAINIDGEQMESSSVRVEVLTGALELVI